MRILFIFLTSSLFLISCAQKAVFKTSKVVPAAEGEVKVKKVKNGNYRIAVEIKNLASPEKLSPSKDYYVVWNKSKEGTFNIGVLELDKDLNGILETESTYEVQRIIVSAENDAKEVEPGKIIVLKSKKL